MPQSQEQKQHENAANAGKDLSHPTLGELNEEELSQIAGGRTGYENIQILPGGKSFKYHGATLPNKMYQLH